MFDSPPSAELDPESLRTVLWVEFLSHLNFIWSGGGGIQTASVPDQELQGTNVFLIPAVPVGQVHLFYPSLKSVHRTS